MKPCGAQQTWNGVRRVCTFNDPKHRGDHDWWAVRLPNGAAAYVRPVSGGRLR